MLQIILLLVVACVIAYFITTSRKSKVEEVSKGTAPLNPTSDPVYHTQPEESEIIPVKSKAIASVQKVEALKESKKVVKKAAPKKKATK